MNMLFILVILVVPFKHIRFQLQFFEIKIIFYVLVKVPIPVIILI